MAEATDDDSEVARYVIEYVVCKSCVQVSVSCKRAEDTSSMPLLVNERADSLEEAAEIANGKIGLSSEALAERHREIQEMCTEVG